MLTIGRLARASHVTPDTIRFYHRLGLLSPPSRTDSGYRLYDRRDVRRLAFIKHAQQCGLSLQSIRELMQVPESADARESAAYWAARRELPEIDRRIAALQALRGALRTFVEGCAARPGQPCLDPTEVLSHALDAIVNAKAAQADNETAHAAIRPERDAAATVAA